MRFATRSRPPRGSANAGLAAGLAFVTHAAAVVPVAAQGFPAPAPDAPAGTGAARACSPQGVEGAARCGVFRVWEDRDARSGATVDIAFVVLEALEPDAREGWRTAST